MNGPGHSGVCQYGEQAIEEARNPSITFIELHQLRLRLACPGCVQAFDLEIRLKTTLATFINEIPPPELHQRISAALGSMDLSSLDITDF